MKSKQTKKKTIGLIDVMIQHADKGASGFWTDDYEGCGNPKIFPEFDDGLKHGKYVHKEHYLCPWNTAILYGDGHGNINTGCYHSCSIRDARYLSTEMLAAVLTRFKEQLQSDKYDNTEHINPLLTQEEQSYIRQQQILERENQERQWKKDRESKADGKQRSWFAMCYYSIPCEFMGCIEKKTKKNICFKRIYVSGMYPDGDCFEGKEDHVWMDIQGFEDFKVGDCASFYADIYRYIKTGNGKVLDYSLRNPQNIRQITSYELPSDDDLIKQSINQILCETCYLSEHCNKTYCPRNQKELQALREQMSSMISPK